MNAKEVVILDKGALYAFYDLQMSPVTFDFFQFLILADLDRRARGLGKLHVVIIPEATDIRKKFVLDRFDEVDMNWRIRQILVPGCSLMPSCGGLVTVCGSRTEAANFFLMAGLNVFPEGSSIENSIPRFQLSEITAVHVCGETWSSLKATSQAVDMVRSWIKSRANGRRVISITLREAGYGNEKNSNIAEWARFAHSLDADKYLPVVIRDTYAVNEMVPEELDGLTFFNEIAVNIELRMAFYEECYLNLMTNGGPLALCILNHNVRCLSFKPMVKSWHDSTARGLQAAVGVAVGDQPHFQNSFQRWVWADDNYEVIQKYFDMMVAFIDNPGSHTKNGEAIGFFAINREPALKVGERFDKFKTFNSAAIVLRHCLQFDSKNLALRLRVAVNETWIKNFSAADRNFDIILKAEPENSYARLCYADFLAVQSKIDQAIASYRYGILLDPKRITGYLRLGLVLGKIGLIDDALYVVRQAILINPGDAGSYRLCARFLREKGDDQESEIMVEKANELDPEVFEDHL
jgi:tetratricopeptide (TPR) repeat protein